MKLKGMLLGSVLLFSLLLSAVFYAQLEIYREQRFSYQRQVMYYQAKTLAVLAQKLKLHPGEKAHSTLGTVVVKDKQIVITLYNEHQFTLAYFLKE